VGRAIGKIEPATVEDGSNAQQKILKVIFFLLLARLISVRKEVKEDGYY